MSFAKLCFPRKQTQGGMLQDSCQRKRLQEQMLQACAAKGSDFLVHHDVGQSLENILTNLLTGQKKKLRPREEKASVQGQEGNC